MRTNGKSDPPYVTLKSSTELGWSTLLAEFRSCRRSEGFDPAAPMAKIAIVLGGSRKGAATYKMGRNRLPAELTPGGVWLKSLGAKYDGYEIASPKVQVLDLYLFASVFAQLSDDYSLPAESDRLVRFKAGAQYEVINQAGASLLSEMMSPTAAGRMLAETSSLLLAARLVHAHLDADGVGLPVQSRQPLDDRRLKRVLDYTRVFRRTTGMTPAMYRQTCGS
jgi:AraC family transcriptional regulator